MERYAVLGQHIQHSRSPQIHLASALYLHLKIEYTILDYSLDDLNRFLTDGAYLKYSGLSITTPYKEFLANYFDAKLASANTLKITRNGVQAFSTDAEGFSIALSKAGCKLAELKRVYFLGNGGAAMALIAFLKQTLPALEIYVLRRQQEKDEAFFPIEATFLNFYPRELEQTLINDESSLIVQACLPSAPILSFMEKIPGFKGLFFDLNYNQETLTQLASKLDIRYSDGLLMLIGQALAAQKIWWGKSAPFDYVANEISTKRAIL